MTASIERHELILYATPRGPLLDACDRYFARARALGGTTAQTYPPHVTLTGFFRRSTARRNELVGEIDVLLRQWGAVPAHAVSVDALTVGQDWVGLAVSSRWLRELAEEVAEHDVLGEDDDPLRLKDWLHLSLAYGDLGDRPIADYADLAVELVDPTLAVTWDVGLWERNGDPTAPTWQRHA